MYCRNIIDYLTESEKKYPEKTAYADEKKSITYSQLFDSVRRIAFGIYKKTNGGTNKPIAIYMEKGVDMICAFLAIAYSGNFYSPIDVKMPLDRVNNIFNTLNPILLVESKSNKLPLSVSCERLDFEDTLESRIEDNLENVRKKVLDIDPLYVLFTSGSTGVPKGVTISHRGVIDYVEWLTETFGFDQTTIFGNQAPFYFDNSILDIYSTLKNGSTMEIIPEKKFVFPNKVLEYLNEKKVNTIFWVPSALISVANSGALDNVQLETVNKVLFCGEVMPNKQLNIWREHYPNISYANLYGPTEITDVCTYYIVDRAFDDDEPLPIGKACENMEVLIINDENKLVEVNEPGELCVRGCGVSSGYYSNIDKSVEAFVQNPLNSNYRDIIYKTGDIVKINELGEIIYLSRKDFQIKHQGHRIELGEIEVAAAAVEDVLSSCALYDDVHKKIVLFYTCKKTDMDKELYMQLKKRIPGYMLPSKLKCLDEFPYNANGKIDRVKLKDFL